MQTYVHVSVYNSVIIMPMYLTVPVFEVGRKISLGIKAFQPTTPSSQSWGTSVVLPFEDKVGNGWF